MDAKRMYCFNCLGSLTAHPTHYGFCHCGGSNPVKPTVLTKKNLMAAMNIIAATELKGEKVMEQEETIDSLTKKLAEMGRVIGDTSDTISHLKEELNRINNITHYRKYLDDIAKEIRTAGIEVAELECVKSPTTIVSDAVKDLVLRYMNQQEIIGVTLTSHDELVKERDLLADQLKKANQQLFDSFPFPYIPSEIDASSGVVSMSRADYDALMKDLENYHNAISCPTTDDPNVVIAKDEWDAKNKRLAELTEMESKFILQLEELSDKLSSSFRENNSLRRLADSLEKSVEYLKIIHAQEMMLASAESEKKCVHESCSTACLAEEISRIDNMESD